jgi:hypothetical protein
LIILYFAFLQTKVNSGKATYISDAKIAVQIDRYSNWQSPAMLDYRLRDDGKLFTNYLQSASWAMTGTRTALVQPVSMAVVPPISIHPKRHANMPKGKATSSTATHSGWVVLGLPFRV